MFKIGDIVHFGGCFWEIEGFETDPEGYLAISLIEPNLSNEALAAGETAARVIVRDLRSITFERAA